MNIVSYKRDMLLYFIHIYLSRKDLKMKDFMNNLYVILDRNKHISMKQFMTLLKFLEREKQFIGVNRTKIIKYFFPLIKGYKSNDNQPQNTLDF